ncbi:TPR domain protein [Poronia punctata]|nr:TPR domain protein [Poronia punctata]
MDPSQAQAALEGAIAAAKLADSRRGYIPRDHPSPQSVLSKFYAHHSMQKFRDQAGGYGVFTTTPIPPAYHPCILPADDLEPIAIKQMMLQEHHRGRKVLLRVLTEQTTINAVMAVVEDEEGTALPLQLYHQPKRTTDDVDDVLRANMVLIVKEPFFKMAGDGSYSIRVDHVSDVIWLLPTDPRIPQKWRNKRLIAEESVALRGQGNAAVGIKHWIQAEELYSRAAQAAKTPEEEQLANLNRSFANFRLRRPERALGYASKAQTNQTTEKGLFREARALYDLGRFRESLEKWEKIIELYSHKAEARSELERSQKRIREAETGEYDFDSMYRQVKVTPPLIDCATYSVPVVIGKTEHGNGLFTTRDVKAGDLLLCEKAFAYCFADQTDPLGRKNLSLLLQLDSKKGKFGGQAQLMSQIIQKLYHSSEASKEFRSLYHGDYKTVAVSEVDGHPIVDTFFVDRVTSFNAFGSPRMSDTKPSPLFRPDQKTRDEPESTNSSLFLLASRINHACIGNCARSFIGDVMMVRACQDLEAGTELRFPYKPPASNTTYSQRQKNLIDGWGFECECDWCMDLKATTKEMLSRRKPLLNKITEAFKKRVTAAQREGRRVDQTALANITKLLNLVSKTYPNRKGAFSLELWEPYLALGMVLAGDGHFEDGAQAAIKAFEAFGYDIDVTSFEIRKWGYICPGSIEAFRYLARVYEGIEPALCEKMKGYARIVHKICMGTEVNYDCYDCP